MVEIGRRRLLAATGAGLAATAVGGQPAHAAFPSDPFLMGVASGDALSTRIVLWTRLAPDPTAAGSGMNGQPDSIAVHWRIATSPGGVASDATSLRHGNATATAFDGYSVHVDVIGLHPGRTYYYQFTVPGHGSPIGRTRTAPAAGTAETVTFAVLNCQNVAGPNKADGSANPMYYNGLGHLVGRDDIDFVAHLGDYIYEFGRKAHIPPAPCASIVDYRRRYGQYRLRSSLQEMHRLFPVYAVPDDHEFYNNVSGGSVPADKLDLYNEALRAYWENMPIRGGRPALVNGKRRLTLHRRIRWGSLLDLFLVDNRQYRTSSALLGTAQQQWLLDGIATSPGRWTAIGIGVPMTYFPPAAGADRWATFADDRSAITDALAARIADASVFNPVMLSGDLHCGIVSHVRQRNTTTSRLVATEFVNAPLTSHTTADLQATAARDPEAIRKVYNHQVGGGWSSYRGYLACTVTAASWRSQYFIGDDVGDPYGTVTAATPWAIDSGAPVGSVHPA